MTLRAGWISAALAGALLAGAAPAVARADLDAAGSQTVGGPTTTEGSAPDETAPTTTHRLDPAEPGADGTYGSQVAVTLFADDGEEGSGVARTEYRLDGGEWKTYGEEVLFDGTPQSYAQWRQAPVGAFALLPDGSIQSVGGLGMLWHPKAFGDVAIKVQFRDVAPDGFANSGVFVRFPDPDAAVARLPEDQYPCQSGLGQIWTAWVAIACGHEIQIYDGPTGESQKTGSVYNFQATDLEQARPTAKGVWNDYEIRTVGAGDYTVTVIRNGEVLNTFVNSPGKAATRAGDPPTDLRQFAAGHVGLQNHMVNDVIQFRDVRVQHLTPEGGTFTITGAGQHTIEYRSIDVAGNVEPTRTVSVQLR